MISALDREKANLTLKSQNETVRLGESGFCCGVSVDGDEGIIGIGFGH